MVYVTLKDNLKLFGEEKQILEKELRNFDSEVDYDWYDIEDGTGYIKNETYREFEMGRFLVSLKITFSVTIYENKSATYWEPAYIDMSDPVIDDVEVDEIYEYDEFGEEEYIEDEEREKAVIKAIEKEIYTILEEKRSRHKSRLQKLKNMQ